MKGIIHHPLVMAFHWACSGAMLVGAIAVSTSLLGIPGNFLGHIWSNVAMLPDAAQSLSTMFGGAAAAPAMAAAAPAAIPPPVVPPVIDYSMHMGKH
jgi:hypothetical protein